jgi:hypothetical protein
MRKQELSQKIKIERCGTFLGVLDSWKFLLGDKIVILNYSARRIQAASKQSASAGSYRVYKQHSEAAE